MSLPKRRVLSPLIPGSRTPEEFRMAVKDVSGRRGKSFPSAKAGYDVEPVKVGYDVEPKKKTPDTPSTARGPRSH
jgi:hypothetical protein